MLSTATFLFSWALNRVKQIVTSWDLKIGKYPSGANKPEPIGENKYRVLSTGFQAIERSMPIQLTAKGLGVTSQSRKVFLFKTCRHCQGYVEAAVGATDVYWSMDGQ